MICMKKLRFSSYPKAKVGCQGSPGSARAQPWFVVQVATLSFHPLRFPKERVSRLTFSNELTEKILTRVTLYTNEHTSK